MAYLISIKKVGMGGDLEIIYLHFEILFVIDPCRDYNEDKDDWQRSTGYIIPKNSQTMKCDRRSFKEGWYRFTSGAGGRMPSKCPPARACGKQKNKSNSRVCVLFQGSEADVYFDFIGLDKAIVSIAPHSGLIESSKMPNSITSSFSISLHCAACRRRKKLHQNIRLLHKG